jgi:PAS domain S-box-containing protein
MKSQLPGASKSSERRLSLGFRSKMLLAFSSIFVVSFVMVVWVYLFGVPYTSYIGAYGEEKREAFENLSTIADLKKQILFQWLNERKNNAKALATNKEVISGIEQVRGIAALGKKEGKSGEELAKYLTMSEGYKNLSGFFSQVLGSYNVAGKLHVVDAETGIILVSTEGNDVGMDLAHGDLLKEVMDSKDDSAVEIENDPSNSKACLVFSHIVLGPSGRDSHKENPLAILRLYVDVEAVLRPLLYSGGELSGSGDFVLLDRDCRILMPLKFSLPGGTTAKVLEYRSSAEPARLAAKGNEGIILADDYRGVPVLAAYRYIQVTPEQGWGFVVKRDRSEVFDPIWRNTALSSIIGLIGLMGSIVAVTLVSRAISKPVETLSRAARRVAAGNLDVRITAAGSDEIRDLADTFNRMIERIQNWNSDLQEQVKLRTEELEQSSEFLARSESNYRELVENANSIILRWNREGRITFFNEFAQEFFGYDQNEIIGRPAVGTIVPKKETTGRDLSSLTEDILKNPQKYANNINENVKRNGESVWVAWTNKSVVDDHGRIVEVLSIGNDITERRRLEQDLIEERNFNDLMIDSLPGIFYLFDSDGNFLRWNKNFETVSGRSGQEISAMRPSDFFADDEKPIVDEAVKAVFSLGQKTVEADFLAKDGTRTSYLFSGTRIVFDGVPCLVGMGLDVSERRRAEIALIKTSETLRSIFQASPDAIMVMNPDGMVEMWNRSAEKLFGWSEQEVLGSLNPILTGAAQEEFIRLRERVFQGEAVSGLELKRIRKDGKTIDVSLSNAPLRDANGRVVGIVGILSDISRRKKSEEVQRRLATAIEQSIESIVITDRVGKIQYVNPAFELISGYSKEEVIGSDTRFLKSHQNDKSQYMDLMKAVKRGESWKGRLVSRRKDGKLFYEDVAVSPVRDSNGKVTNFVDVGHDVSEHVELQQQLLQAQRMEAIGTLAGGIAHDFNNLLQVVLGYSELLMTEERLDVELRDDAGKINQAAKTGAELVRRLMTFGRKSEARPLPLNLNRQIEQVRKLLDRTIPKMIKMELILADDLPAINADPSQVGQILMNLSINSRDAMLEGGKLTIETQRMFLDEEYCRTHLGVSAGDYVLLTLSDTGAGMSSETLEHIFEPFYTTKKPGEGTGLGLSMVYGIVQQHGGIIRCYSEPGQGTSFKVYFPALIQKTTYQDTSLTRVPRGGSETILLVDDEKLIRDLGATILRKAGYRVIAAENGKQALEVFAGKNQEISLVILDLIMPEMGGRQCLDELLKIDPNVRVLISSGYSVNGHGKDALRAGARGFIAKPYDTTNLLDIIRETLD